MQRTGAVTAARPADAGRPAKPADATPIRVAVACPDARAGQELVEAVARLAPAFRLETAPTLEAALESAGAGLHALVLDDELPGGNLAQAVITAASRAPQVPVVLLVAPARLDAALQALPLGAADIVLKRPPHEPLLAVALHQVIGQRRLLVEIASLRSSEARLRSIVESLPAPVAVIAPDGTCLAMNWAGLGLIGATRVDEIVGRSLPDLVTPSERDDVRAFLSRVAAGEPARIDIGWPTVGQSGDTVRIQGVPLRRDDSGATSALCTLSRPDMAAGVPAIADIHTAEVDALRDGMATIERELADTRAALDAALRDAGSQTDARLALDEERTRRTEAERALGEARTREAAAAARCAELEAAADRRRQAQDADRAALEERVSALETVRATLSARLAEAEANEAARADAEVRSGRLADEVDRLRTELDAVRTAADDRVRKLESELTDARHAASGLEERCQAAERRALQLGPTEAALEEARARASAAEARHREACAERDATIAAQHTRIEEADRRADAAEERGASLQNALEEARRDVEHREAAHAAERARWDETVADLQRRIEEASDRTRDAEHRAGLLHRSLEEEASPRLRAAVEEVARLASRVEELAAALGRRDIEIASHRQTGARLEQALDAATRLADDLRTQLAVSTEEAARREQESALASEYHRDRLETLQGHLADEQQLRAELESRVRELDAEIVALGADLVAARERIQTLDEERAGLVSRAEADKARHQDEQRSLDERLARAAESHSHLEAQLATLEAKQRQLEDEREAAHAHGQTLARERAEIAAARDRLEDDLAALRVAHGALSARHAAAETRSRTLEEDMARLRASGRESEQTIHTLEERLAARERERDEALAEMGRLEEAHRDACDRLRAESAALREQLSAAETALATLRERPPIDERQRRALTHALEERTRLEAELSKTQGLLRRLFACDAVARAVTTFDGRMVRFNAAFARLFAYGSGGADRAAALQAITGREAVNARLHLEGRVSGVELHVKRSDGRTCTVVETAVVVRDPGQEPVVERTFVDVSEARALDAELRRVRRLEAVGRMAAGLAEELAACLDALDASCHVVTGFLGANDPARTEAARAAAASRRARALADQLRAYGLRQARDPVLLDLSVVLRQAEPVLRRLAGQDVSLEIAPGADVSLVSTDRELLDQALTSLVVVGRDLLPAGGTLTVATVDEGAPSSLEARRASASGAVCLVVTASGFGCRPPGDLTALETLAADCGGRLRVDTTPGRRAEIALGLPAVPPATGPEPWQN